MPLQGWLTLVCAGSLLCADPTPTPPKEGRDSAVADALAVQTALQQGREHLLRRDYRNAVHVLEAQLARINGSRVYLDTLREAYRGYVQALRLAERDADAEVYVERLRILDPGVLLDQTPAPALPKPAPQIDSKPAVAEARPAAPPPKVRLKGEEDGADPFHPSRAVAEARPASRETPVRDLLTRAEEAFSRRNYHEAGQLYDKAHEADRAATDACKDRWAYCKLHGVVERMNRPGAGPEALAGLEQEVRAALELAPRLDYGNVLLAEIRKRRAGGPGETLPVPVRHLPAANGWQVAESPNFRVHHKQAREFAEQAVRVAERARAEADRKWFGRDAEAWEPKCDVYLHATAADYTRAEGVPGTSPGHSNIEMETGTGRVVGRRIHLRCDEVNMLTAVLPHEATHVVIAGQFGERPVPRWADEGIAVLAEPREKVERHLRNLDRCRREGGLFPVQQLMQLDNYPDPRAITAFYAQSVSVVEFLSNERGPRVFSEFLRDGLRSGYEGALQRHYGFRGFAELEERWQRFATGGADAVTQAGYDGQGR